MFPKEKTDVFFQISKTICMVLFACFYSISIAQENDSQWSNNGLSFYPQTNECFFSGNFIVDSTYEIDGIILYTIVCIDTTDLKWGGHFNLIHNYYGIKFTVVTLEEEQEASGDIIQRGNIYFLKIMPYHGFWQVYDHYGSVEQYEKVYRKDGSYITLQRDSIYNQLMVSPNIKGSSYFQM